MKSRTKHRINPDSKSAFLTVALTETKAKLIKEGARFCKVDLEEYVVYALSYRTVEILSKKKGFLESIRYRKLFFEALDGVDQKKRMLKWKKSVHSIIGSNLEKSEGISEWPYIICSWR